MEQEERSTPGIIMPRIQLVAEVIPEDEFPDLPDQNSVFIFLEVEDPEDWPSEMSHLKKYLQPQE